ncbi:MAG: PhzF family phenazine biosynthesis protein [Cyanobacteria bacterium P01_D01_bin.73]
MANQAYPFYTADVFSDRPFGGNPLAVFPVADSITDDQMLRIAQEFNLSETVFVQLPRTPRADRRLRIFTPTGEIPFAGHPTIGAAAVLTLIGEVPATSNEAMIYLEETVGFIPVKIRVTPNQPVYAELMVSQAPSFEPAPAPLEKLAAAASLTESDFLDPQQFPPLVGSCGLPFLILPVKDFEVLGRSQLSQSIWQEHLGNTPGAHLYLIAPQNPEDPKTSDQWRVRMYAPALGIREDPATGSAATVLGGYLAQYGASSTSISTANPNKSVPLKDGEYHWQIEQGIEMDRPSSLSVHTTVENQSITAIRVGGHSTLMSKGQFLIPDI